PTPLPTPLPSRPPFRSAVALIYAGSVIEIFTGGPDIWLESAGMFVFFLCVGRYLEMRARHHAGDLSDAEEEDEHAGRLEPDVGRSEEHTSELHSPTKIR